MITTDTHEHAVHLDHEGHGKFGFTAYLPTHTHIAMGITGYEKALAQAQAVAKQFGIPLIDYTVEGKQNHEKLYSKRTG